MKNSDLHAHSYYSDGMLSPREVVKLAKKKRLKYLALTDHSSISGVKEAIAAGKKFGVEVIPAIELECEEAEVLGYFVDINNKNFCRKVRAIAVRREQKAKDFCMKLEKAGYNVKWTEVYKKYSRGKGNINQLHPVYELSKRGYGGVWQIFKELKKKGIKGKTVKKVSVIEGIKMVRNAGGVAVLAHPWFAEECMNRKFMKKMIKAGLQGLERDNGDRMPLRKASDLRKISAFAKKYNLILTSGSDFHGKEFLKQQVGNHNLGDNNCDEKVVCELLKRKLGKRDKYL